MPIRSLPHTLFVHVCCKKCCVIFDYTYRGRLWKFISESDTRDAEMWSISCYSTDESTRYSQSSQIRLYIGESFKWMVFQRLNSRNLESLSSRCCNTHQYKARNSLHSVDKAGLTLDHLPIDTKIPSYLQAAPLKTGDEVFNELNYLITLFAGAQFLYWNLIFIVFWFTDHKNKDSFRLMFLEFHPF